MGLSLTVDGLEDAELSIRGSLGIVVGDWKLADGQANEQQVEDAVEIEEAPESSNLGYESIDAAYVLKDNNRVETGREIDDRTVNLEDEDSF